MIIYRCICVVLVSSPPRSLSKEIADNNEGINEKWVKKKKNTDNRHHLPKQVK